MNQQLGVRDITMADLKEIARSLCEEVTKSKFEADCVIYLETGSRLLAADCCQRLGVGAIPLGIQRNGARLKRFLAQALCSLPRPIRNGLRQLEAALLWKPAHGLRTIVVVPAVNLQGKSVLILDDAVDTGASVRTAREWAIRMGAAPDSVKIAAIAVTTRLADGLVDYCLYHEMCRFPWSSDSEELDIYRQHYQKTHVPAFEAVAFGTEVAAR